MILPDAFGELLAGLTPDQEDLLEEVLRSPYFHDVPGVLWRLLWCPPQVVRRLWEVLDQMHRFPGVDAGDFEITVRPIQSPPHTPALSRPGVV